MSSRKTPGGWSEVARRRPVLAAHAEVRRHVYRGEISYVVRSAASGKVFRLPLAAYQFVGLLDGRRSAGEIHALLHARHGDAAPAREELAELLERLSAAGLLASGEIPGEATGGTPAGTPPQRPAAPERSTGGAFNPLAIRVPLIDPDRFLARTQHLVAPLFTVPALLAWLAVVLSGVVAAMLHWPELSANVADRVLAADNLVLMAGCFVFIKLLHELGHAWAVRHWGGEVHEMGVLVLVLMPLPYVDASASALFSDKRRRVLVGAAGILVELFVAALALLTWLAVEPGLVRAAAFNLALIGSVSTLLFNGNPLLRFDGYFVLSDYLELPNLARRSNAYCGYLFRRHVLRFGDVSRPDVTPAEARWFLPYAVLAFCYRIFVSCAIALFVATRFELAGLVLAAWALGVNLLLPLLRGIVAVSAEAARQPRPASALGMLVLLPALAWAALFILPAPLSTHAEGVVWAPRDAEVRAMTEGVITELAAAPGQGVVPGDTLFRLDEPSLAARVAVLEAERRELEARYDVARIRDPVEASLLAEQLGGADARLHRARERAAALEVRSAAHGEFIVARPQDLPGRFVERGEILGFVADLSRATVRVAVREADIALLRERLEGVRVRLHEEPSRVITAEIAGAVPDATTRLPSAALGTGGGGEIPLDPSDPEGRTALEPLFDVELRLPRGAERLGGRAAVRFDHGAEPLGVQAWRRLRQLVLARLDA